MKKKIVSDLIALHPKARAEAQQRFYTQPVGASISLLSGPEAATIHNREGSHRGIKGLNGGKLNTG